MRLTKSDARFSSLFGFLHALAGRFPQQPEFWQQTFLVVLAGFMRLWRISIPDALVFDEIYFSVYADNYLTGTQFFDAHPPLGKYLIALGIRVFGFTSFGYRIVDAFFGVGLVILVYGLTRSLFSSRRVAFLAGLFATLDGVLLVESRAGLINIFAVFFSLAAYYLFCRYGEENLEKPRWMYLVGSGICVGLATATKWIGFASFGVILGVYVTAKVGARWKAVGRVLPQHAMLGRIAQIHPDLFIFSFVFLPIVAYASSFIIHLNQIPEFQFFELQRQIFGYHANLKATHGYGSPWWSWPLLIRPVCYYWQHDRTTDVAMTILDIGNPILWWFALAATMGGVWFVLFRRNFAVSFALLAIVCHYLPFSLISRVSYLYHFMGALPFTIMLLAFFVSELWRQEGWRREVAAVVVLMILISAVYFFPIWTALPIPAGAYYQRMWFVSWI